MRKSIFPALLTMIFCMSLLCGCETLSSTPTPKKNISEKKESIYIPDYSFTPTATTSAPSGYTVGIINMVVNEDVPEQWVTQGLDSFREAYFKGLESVLLSKGILIKGPFDSYEEMTFPDRDSCSYLIRPVLHLAAHQGVGTEQLLAEYTEKFKTDTTLNWTFYVERPYSVTYTCTMHYEIFEPLTGEKLAIHKLDSEPIVEQSNIIIAQKQTATWNGAEFIDGPVDSSVLGSEMGFYNSANVDIRALERLFKTYMPKTEALLSVEEFAHLEPYKKQLEEKKRY